MLHRPYVVLDFETTCAPPTTLAIKRLMAAGRHHRALDDVRATAELPDRLVAAAEARGIAVGE